MLLEQYPTSLPDPHQPLTKLTMIYYVLFWWASPRGISCETGNQSGNKSMLRARGYGNQCLFESRDREKSSDRREKMAKSHRQGKATKHAGSTQQTLRSLLCSEERDFLIRNNGDKVRVEELEGKFVGLYFSAHWCPPCRAFTPLLSQIYTELLEKGDFEIVFISSDEDQESFQGYHQSMPWLAIPFSDSQTKDKLRRMFQVNAIPTLIILGKDGTTLHTEGVDMMRDLGVKAYPFTPRRVEVPQPGCCSCIYRWMWR